MKVLPFDALQLIKIQMNYQVGGVVYDSDLPHQTLVEADDHIKIETSCWWHPGR